ncbi:MAG: DUF5777 family beta-barrel protein [Bacteroidota bacterium]|jgi:hypothetical protein
MKSILTIICLLFSFFKIQAQDDLLSMLPDDKTPEAVTGTFKSTRIINGQSIETVAGHHLDYRVSHRFGPINSGSYQFYGLDQGYIYMGFEYGITDNLMVGIGRSSEQKMLNLFTKMRLLKQKTNGGSPISVTFMAEGYADMLRYPTEDTRTNLSKYSYMTQALIARKINDKLSLQIMPTYLYRNRNNEHGETNGVFSVGLAGRYKMTKRTAFVGEYYYVLPNQINEKYKNSLSFGFDIETGGHVFSLHFTNSTGMITKQFLAETVDTWADGGVHFGFNLGRSFGLGKKYKGQYKVPVK